MNTSTGGSNKANRRLASNNSNTNSCNKDSKFINVNGLINTSNGAHLIPVLPATKKPFWISHLKLAESREIELNTYVQKILKLPIKISHSPLVLQFFESQSSDPKPNKPKSFTNSMKIENSENGTDSMEDDRDFNDLDDDVDDINSNNNIDVDFNNFDDEFIDNEDDINDEFIDDDDDDEDEDDDIDDNGLYTDDVTNLNSNGTNSNQKKLNSISKKRISREAGLWWDNADALNELTSSTSFDFGSKYNINSNNHLHHSQHIISEQDINEQNDYNYELETLKSLESILKNSDLFYSSTSAAVTNTLSNDESKEKKNFSSATKHDAKTSSKSDILVRRLSLS